MGLFNFFKKNKQHTKPTAEYQDYSFSDEELMLQFSQKYETELNQVIDNFEVPYLKMNDVDDYDEKLALLNIARKEYFKAKEFCYSKGRGGKLYFRDMYERLHNSKNTCFSYEDMINNSIKGIIETKKIREQLLNLIKENDGILQRDIYSLLPSFEKDNILRCLRALVVENIVYKVKVSNTNELHLVK